MIARLLPDNWIPKDIPKELVSTLIWVILFLGLSGFRYGRGDMWQGFLHVLENWIVMLIIIPAGTALVSMPMKYRDPSFDVRMAYYLGMFVSLLFMFGKLRYWR